MLQRRLKNNSRSRSRSREPPSSHWNQRSLIDRELERIIREGETSNRSSSGSFSISYSEDDRDTTSVTRRSRRSTALVQRVRDHAQKEAGYFLVMDMVISNLQQQRQVTEQLRREAAIKRINVSKAIEDLMKYITEHEQEDCLLVGFSSQKSNPFREKSSCAIL